MGGGHIIVKTNDDNVKLSYPDKNNTTKQIFALYEKLRVHHVPTVNTDRYHGEKCSKQLTDAGFKNLSCIYNTHDTLGKNFEERMKLYEICFGFRNICKENEENKSNKAKMAELLTEQKKMFEQDDYYFLNVIMWFTAQKNGQKKIGKPNEQKPVKVKSKEVAAPEGASRK